MDQGFNTSPGAAGKNNLLPFQESSSPNVTCQECFVPEIGKLVLIQKMTARFMTGPRWACWPSDAPSEAPLSSASASFSHLNLFHSQGSIWNGLTLGLVMFWTLEHMTFMPREGRLSQTLEDTMPDPY